MKKTFKKLEVLKRGHKVTEVPSTELPQVHAGADLETVRDPSHIGCGGPNTCFT